MSAPTQARLNALIKKQGRYRLGCDNCDREDFDGVKSLPKDWEGIRRIQSLRDALTTYDDENDPEPPPGFSVMDWQTHLGLCPDCQESRSFAAEMVRGKGP